MTTTATAGRRVDTIAGYRIAAYTRDEWMTDVWPRIERPGDHVTVLGPTGSGKSTLLADLVGAVATPQRPALVMAVKPRDATMTRWAADNGHRIVRRWPALPVLWPFRRPSGYVVWPRHSYDPDIDWPRQYAVFRRVILDSYARGNRIVVADEVANLANILRLHRELILMWLEGRAMGAGQWVASQRARGIPTQAYDQAIHLYLHYDPDKVARDRYDEIGGVDPRMVREITAALQWHRWLYIGRRTRSMALIDP